MIRWYMVPQLMLNAELLAEWDKLECEADPEREQALSDEIALRELDV